MSLHESQIPDALKQSTSWVLWKSEERDGKTTKVPYHTVTRKASSTDPGTWRTFPEALKIYRDNETVFSGIGFVFCEETNGLVGVDIDRCRDADTGEIAEWALPIVDQFSGTYCEISPSGTGFHIFAFGRKKGAKCKKTEYGSGAVEMYSTGRYFTVTGNSFGATEVTHCQDSIDWLYATVWGSVSTNQKPTRRTEIGFNGSDIDLLLKAHQAINGAKFSRLWRGDTSEYGSRSEADMALAGMLSFWTGPDAGRIQSLMQQSGLAREKWQREDYLPRTVAACLEGRTEFYEPIIEVDHGVDLTPLLESLKSLDDPDEVKDPGELPDDMYLVPGFVADFVAFTIRTARRPNKALALAAALSTQAYLCGRKVRDKENTRTNLNIIALAKTGAGKDYPREVAGKVVSIVDPNRGVADRIGSGQGIEDHMQNALSALFMTDEFDEILSRINNTRDGGADALINSLLTFATSAHKEYQCRVLSGKERVKIEQPNLCVYGSAVPSSFFQAVSDKVLRKGLLSRSIVIEVGKRGPKQRRESEDLPESIKSAAEYWKGYRTHTGNLEQNHPDPHCVPHTSDADRLADEYSDQCDDRLEEASEAESVAAEELWTRAAEKANRLALIYACSRCRESPVIDVDAVRWATRFVDHTTFRLLARIGDSVAPNEHARNCQEVMKMVNRLAKGTGVVKRSRITKKLQYGKIEHDRIMETLKDQGKIEVVTVNSGTPGRNGVVYKPVRP